MKNISANAAKELQIHFVYGGHYYFGYYFFGYEDILRSFILNGTEKHKIKSAMVTSIFLERWDLITKEKMERFCKGEEYEEDSVNDDLESLFENIRLGKEPDEEVYTYFLPRLTEEELELVERGDTSYLRTLDETGMMLSESDSQYVLGRSRRKTFGIENSSQMLAENSSET